MEQFGQNVSSIILDECLLIFRNFNNAVLHFIYMRKFKNETILTDDIISYIKVEKRAVDRTDGHLSIFAKIQLKNFTNCSGGL